MIKTVLVPLDGSQLAERGLLAACRLARETGATLVLMRAVQFYGDTNENEAMELEVVREAQQYLQALEQRLERDGFTVRTEVLPALAARAILFAAEAQHADVISMSTHGRSGLRYALLGSVAEVVVRQSRRPILLVRAPDGPEQPAPATTPFRNILIPLDGTTLGEAALSYLATEQLGHAADVILLRTVMPTMVAPMPLMSGEGAAELFRAAEAETERHRVEAEEYLATSGKSFLQATKWRTRVTIGDPVQEILGVASVEQADLIVMATHGRRGLDRLVYGSVARSVLHRTKVPLLLLHGADTTEDEPK